MSNIEWILIIITIFLVILLFRYIQLKKQIRNLADQVNELNSGNSQQMLDISLIDKDLERLAGILNQYNIRQRQAVAGVLRNEEYLKESVANISHDLRTPLTVILGHLQLLQKENLESSQAQRVKVIFSKAEKMKELVETIAKALVDSPDEVVVSETENEREILITLHVASDDMGKVIGKQGRIAKAIRAVVKAAASKEDKKVIVEIMQ